MTIWQFVALRSQGTLFERPEQRSQPNLTLLALKVTIYAKSTPLM
jgi:hypothetical protein